MYLAADLDLAGAAASGLPLGPGLRALAEESPRGAFRAALIGLADAVERGEPLDRAVEEARAAAEETASDFGVGEHLGVLNEAERVVMFDIAVSTAEEASPDPSAPAEETPVEETPVEESPPAPEEAAEQTTEPTP